jgi:hypothetical protein
MAKTRGMGDRRKLIILQLKDKDIDTAIAVLRDAMANGDMKERLAAATYILDQRFGRARQAVELTGGDDGNIIHKIDVRIHNATCHTWHECTQAKS